MDGFILGFRTARPSVEVCFLCGLRYKFTGEYAMSDKSYHFNLKLINSRLRACSYTKDLTHVCNECQEILDKQENPFAYIVADFRKRYETVD